MSEYRAALRLLMIWVDQQKFKYRLPDHACRECIVDEINVDGFQCAYHTAVALLARPEPEPMPYTINPAPDAAAPMSPGKMFTAVATYTGMDIPRMKPRTVWQSIESAPKDGTLILLLIYIHNSKHPTEQRVVFRTIGHNNLDNDGEDAWQFAGWCWEHDHFTQATGEPISWMPLPPLPSPPAASDGE